MPGGVTESRHSKEKGLGVGGTWGVWETAKRCVAPGKEGGFNLSTWWSFSVSGGSGWPSFRCL